MLSGNQNRLEIFMFDEEYDVKIQDECFEQYFQDMKEDSLDHSDYKFNFPNEEQSIIEKGVGGDREEDGFRKQNARIRSKKARDRKYRQTNNIIKV